jgi:hypothetical protein
VTQPLNQRARCEALGKLDTAEGEFWMENPWEGTQHNLSAYERNRVFLNAGGQRFIDVSYLTTADLDSDSRGVVTADLNGDGMPDLLVRSSGGGPLRMFENLLPRQSWVTISLRGVQSNRLGLGAKLKAEAGGTTQWRELYPVASFQSQLPSLIHFGLGAASRLDRLTIQWPSGATQTLEGLDINCHWEITEGSDQPRRVKGKSEGGRVKSEGASAARGTTLNAPTGRKP